MNGTIEEKVHLDTKIIFVFVGTLFLSDFVDLCLAILEQNTDNFLRIRFMTYIFFIAMSLIFSLPNLMKTATKLTLEQNSITVKLIARKPLTIYLEDIQKINTLGYAGDRPSYIIKSKSLNFNTTLISMSLHKKGLELFMEEFQLRVDEAKKAIE